MCSFRPLLPLRLAETSIGCCIRLHVATYLRMSCPADLQLGLCPFHDPLTTYGICTRQRTTQKGSVDILDEVEFRYVLQCPVPEKFEFDPAFQ